MAERQALWVCTSTETRDGITAYVRVMQQTPLWTDWNVLHVVTHRDGSAPAKIAAFARGTVQFIVELIRFRPSVVHLHAASDTSFVTSRPVRVPVVVYMHGSGIQEHYENSPRAIHAVIRATFCRASCVVALDVWADRLRVIAPTARITVIPNAVAPASRTAQPAPGEPVHVVVLGRIGEHKGTFRLLDAFARLGGRAATLTIAGDGEVEQAGHRIRELGLEDTVELLGPLAESDTGVLDRAQVPVLPSRNEGQPMVVLEAMARGLCVTASDVGGLPEMIRGGCATIVPPDDIEAIAAALRLAVHDHELRARYGASAYARVEDRFDARTVSRRLDALYREVSR